MNANLAVEVCGIKLRNPTVLASGIMGMTEASMDYCIKNGVGAITLKTIGLKERSGHVNPSVISWGEGLINAVGLPTMGMDLAEKKIKNLVRTLPVPILGSIQAGSVMDFCKSAERMAVTGVDALEINVSCPNTGHEFGKMFALDTQMTEELIKSVRQTVPNIPIFVKLSAEHQDLPEIGKAVESAGADGITAINTMTGMIIDVKLKRPILTNKVGGLSGPALRPIGVRAVWSLYKAVKIPIIGTGGINTGEDAIEYIMAGATAVGVGSAIYYRGIDVFKKITDEMREFMEKEGFKTLSEVKGVAHDY